MPDQNLLSLLKKLRPLTEDELGGFDFMMFGSGGFAENIVKKFGKNITKRIEYEDTLCRMTLDEPVNRWCRPENASGRIVLGTGTGSYQYNQLCELAKNGHGDIQEIFLVDPYLQQRNIDVLDGNSTVLLLEHACGVERHGPLLRNFKQYFADKGKVVTSICPLTLHYYNQYLDCQDVIVFSGQRDLYDIGRDAFKHVNLTYMEYGFFPQSEHFYLDKRGVNQDSTLMGDDLNWVNNTHLEKLAEVKNTFLNGFSHLSCDYVLVPLQVPDDPNIAKCSRFTNGMQEFIDYIVGLYPQTQKIVFKAHPKDPQRFTYDYRGKSHSDKPFLSLLENASSVHGITSSTLYEAALACIDVVTEGKSILAKHYHQKDKLFAAMVDRQTSKFDTDFSYILQKYSNLEHRLNQ